MKTFILLKIFISITIELSFYQSLKHSKISQLNIPFYNGGNQFHRDDYSMSYQNPYKYQQYQPQSYFPSHMMNDIRNANQLPSNYQNLAGHVQVSPDYSPHYSPANQYQYLDQGSNYFKSGDLGNAIEYYSKALDTKNINDEEKIISSIAQDFEPEGTVKYPEQFEFDLENTLKQKQVDPNKSDKFMKRIKTILRQIEEEREKLHKDKLKFKKMKRKEVSRSDGSIEEKVQVPPKNETEKLHAFINTNRDLISLNNDIVFNLTDERSRVSLNSTCPKGAELMKIDKSLFLSKNNQVLLPLCDIIKQIPEFAQNYDKICIAVFLVQQKSRYTKLLKEYFSYYSRLNYKNFPIFYNDKEMRLMKGTYFYSLVLARKNLFEKEFNLLKSKTKLISSNVEFREFLKARTFVMSKNISFSRKSGELLSVLAPLIDRVKSSANTNKINAEFSFQKSQLILTSTKEIPQFGEVYIKNGNSSNSHLLLYYGYTYGGNFISSDIFLEMQAKMNANSNHTRELISIPLNAKYHLNSVLTAFRKLSSGDNSTVDTNITMPSDLKTELKALTLLKKTLKATNQKFATNLNSDTIIAKNKKLSPNEVNIYRVIIEEKTIVKKFLGMATLFEKVFKNFDNKKRTDKFIIRQIATTPHYKRYYHKIKTLFQNFTQGIKDFEGLDDFGLPMNATLPLQMNASLPIQMNGSPLVQMNAAPPFQMNPASPLQPNPSSPVQLNVPPSGLPGMPARISNSTADIDDDD